MRRGEVSNKASKVDGIHTKSYCVCQAASRWFFLYIFLDICRKPSLRSQLWRTILRKFPCLPPLFTLLIVDLNTPRHGLRWFLLSLSAINGRPNAWSSTHDLRPRLSRAHHSYAYDRRNASSPNDTLYKSWISLTVLPRFVPDFQTNTPYRKRVLKKLSMSTSFK